MDIAKLRSDVKSAMEEYVATPEAWEDAVIAINPANGKVELLESEEAEALPQDSIDIWNPMDLVEMTPDGAWKVDDENLDSLVDDYN